MPPSERSGESRAGPSGASAYGRGRGRAAGDRGFVTAEAAVVLPVMALFTMALVWTLAAVAAQIQCVDAARAGARAAARSESPAAVEAAARSAAPPNARVTVLRTDDLWRVRVWAPAPGPDFPAVTISAQAAALAEDSMGVPP